MIMQSLFLQVITSGRLESIVAGVIGLISIIIGRYALVRSGRIAAIVSLVLALTCIVLSVLRLSLSTGGFGTGSGRLGAIVAIVVGIIGMVLGGRALARSRRLARGNNTSAGGTG
jgi:hypothetical protein